MAGAADAENAGATEHAEDAARDDDLESVLSLRLPAEDASLPRLREAVRHWLATSTPASRDEQHDILLATWEACANAIEHPLGPLRKEIGVELEVRAGSIGIVVRDSGLWLQPRTSARTQSFGIRLIEALMDFVEVTRNGDGSVVVMRRRLRHDGKAQRRRRRRRDGEPRSSELSRRS